MRLVERPAPRMRTVEDGSMALAVAGIVTVPSLHLVFVTLCRTTNCVQKPLVRRGAVMTTMRGLPNLVTRFEHRESSVTEEAEWTDIRRVRATGFWDKAPRSPGDAARPLRDSS